MVSSDMLSVDDMRKQGAPTNARWFWNKKAMLQDFEVCRLDEGYGGYTCTWKNTSKGYIFGHYATWNDAMEDVMRCPLGQRFGFELIQPDSPCRAYLDVEWVGLQDTNHETVSRIKATIIKTCQEEYGVHVTVKMSCSSRWVGDKFKNSYHITVHGIVFENNHRKGGGMLHFIETVQRNSLPEDRDCIDVKVYTPWRQMRLIFCCKRELVPVPLLPMGGDPLQIQEYDENDAMAYEGYEIMCRTFDNSIKLIPDPEMAPEPSSKCKSAGIKRKANPDRVLCSTEGDLPASIVTELNDVLALNSIGTCEVSGCVRCSGGTDGPMVFCWLRNIGPRQCPFSPGKPHDNENAYMYSVCGSMYYQCRANACKGQRYYLGNAPASYTAWLQTFTQTNKDAGIEGCTSNDAMDANDVSNALDCHDDHGDTIDTIPTKKKKSIVEVIHFLHLFILSILNIARISCCDKLQYLMSHSYKVSVEDPCRVFVVESCTGTGKTTSVVDHAVEEKKCIISLSCVKSQVTTHAVEFSKKGLPTVRYDDRSLNKIEIGKASIVSTIDSISKVVAFLKRDPQNALKYILFLDEFHSVTQYIIFSSTLVTRRRSVMADLQWLIANCFKVIVADNVITNLEMAFIDSALNEDNSPCEMKFIRNTYQKFEGIEVKYRNDRDVIYKKVRKDISKKRGITMCFNTKSEAVRFKTRILADLEGQVADGEFVLRYYSSTEGTLPTNVDEEWEGVVVIYTPTITTGVDFNPKTAQNVYLMLQGEHTISPSTAVQMITRNRNIRKVWICATRMRNKPKWATEADMNHALDTVSDKYQAELQSFQDQNYNFKQKAQVFSDNKFSQLFRIGLWQDNMLRSQYLHSLDGMLVHRGFVVERESLENETNNNHESEIERQKWKDMDCLTKQEAKKNFKEWLDGENNELLMDILATIKEVDYSKIKNKELYLTNSRTQLKNILQGDISKYKIYENIFIYPKTLESNCNLMYSIYTHKKLLQINARNSKKDYIVKIIDTTNSKVLLLHDMITLVNQHLPNTTTKLEVFNLTLHQKHYKEEKAVEFMDIMWDQFKFITRTARNKPETLRGCMNCIYALSKKIFGKYFTDQRKTDRIAKSKRNKKTKITCYNYVTNESLLLCFIEMAWWGDKDADDFHPEIVAKYKIKARIQKDQQAAILCIPSTVSDTVKVPVVYKVDTAAVFES